MIRKNVTFDEESLERLKKLSAELGMNHSEYIRHLLGRESEKESGSTGDEFYSHIFIYGRAFKWDGKRSYVMV